LELKGRPANLDGFGECLENKIKDKTIPHYGKLI
jgi:hypothetical protein